MRVIGVDPGLATTGFAVLEQEAGVLKACAVGAIRTTDGDGEGDRLAYLRSALLELLDAERPEVAAVETLFFNRNASTAMSVGRASGVVLATLAEKAVAAHEYTPLQVKQSVVGVGNASKRQVQTMVAALLGLRSHPRPADAADACALAICHLHRARLLDALRRSQTVAAGGRR